LFYYCFQVKVDICGDLKALASYLLKAFAQMYQKKVLSDAVIKKIFSLYKSIKESHAQLSSAVMALLKIITTNGMLSIA